MAKLHKLLILLVFVSAGAQATTARPTSSRMQSAWNAWLKRRPPPCSSKIDSLSHFGGGRVAVVFHGLGSSPRDMASVVNLLARQGYSVLAPRLAGHYDQNMTDLDFTSYGQWVQDAENVLAIARLSGRPVTLVGFSLGGLLASRLALDHPGEIDKMVLVAPAWRINAMVSLGSLVGSVLDLSLNAYEDIPYACQIGKGFIPARSGQQLELLIMNTEESHWSSYPETNGSAFNQLQVPYLLLTTPNDDALDVPKLNEICAHNAFYCTPVNVQASRHTDMDLNLTGRRSTSAPYRGTAVGSIISRFLGGTRLAVTH
jgi:pimeloyl-ACP methyl ester carboxylesterase